MIYRKETEKDQHQQEKKVNNKQNAMKHILFIVTVFYAYSSSCQVKTDSIEQKAINFILNNLNSLPVYNVEKHVHAKKGKIYYHLYNDSLKIKILIENVLWGKQKLFENDINMDMKKYNVDYSKSLYKNALSTNLTLTEFERKQQKDDVYIGIRPKWSYKESYYTLITFYTIGDLMNSSMIIKFDKEGKIQKFVYEQGVN